MRKLFTRLISIFILIMVFVLQGFAQFPALTPGGDLTNHKKTDVFVLTTSKAVVAGNGVIRLKEGAATLAAYQATNANVSIEVLGDGSSKISVNFTSFLAEEKTYALEVDANFVKDQTDVPSSAGNWSVTVGDFTPPMLASSNPLLPKNGETVAVQLDNNLTITFNEAVQLATDGQIFVYKDNGTPRGDLFTIATAANLVSGMMTPTLEFDLGVDFAEKTKYYVTIPTGAIVDYNAAPLVDNKNVFEGWLTNDQWVFTTRDAGAPEVVEIMADNLGATSFDVFTKINKKGKVQVLPVGKGQTPVAADFTAANGMKEVTVNDAAASVKTSHTQYLNKGTGVAALVEGGEYDVWVVTINAETVDPTVSAPMKKLEVQTVDVTAPTATLYYPAIGETEATVNEGGYIYIVADEALKVGTGEVEVYTWDASLNHTLLVSVPAASCMVTEKGAKDTLFIPVDKALWMSEGVYFVKYSEGIATDLAGNKLAGVSTTEGWKFTVQDFLAPTYTVVPANGATNASEVAPQITITFNEDLYSDNAGTPMADPLVGLSLKNSEGTAVTMTVNSFDGKVIKLDIDPAEVTSTAAFQLSIDTKKFFDASGNVGKTVDVIAFSLKDYEGPVVTIEPALAGASDNILVKFNEPVFNANGTAVTNADVANMVIFRKGNSAAGAIVAATYSVAADAKSFIIDPTNDFTTPGDEYFVRLGAGAVKDAAGNANVLAEQIVVVKDFKVPTATWSGIGTSPVDPGTVAPVLTFSEAMELLDGTPVAGDATDLVTVKENGENITFTATWGGTLDNPTITITAAWAPNADYTISVGKSLQDVSENKFAGASTAFKTMSNVAPAVVSVSPADGAVQQANNVPLVITFDQPVTGSGAGITFTGTSATVGTVSVSGAVATIGHTDFVTDETITVNVPAGYFVGVNTIAAPAVSWTFSTRETVIPTPSVYEPLVGATDVALNAVLKITYSEDVVLKTGTIVLKDRATDVTVQTLSEANCVVKDGDRLEITPIAALDYNKEYYVEMTAGLVEDVNGNKAAAMTGPDNWHFTTAATPGAFVVASSVPADGDDKVAGDLNTITVTFNRDIKPNSASASALIIVENITDSEIVIADAANTSRFLYDGATLQINTASDLEPGKEYLITIQPGIVTDTWNTPNDGATITFYTFDNNGPEVASHTPAKDATNVPKTTNVVLTWDETPLFGGAPISAATIKAQALVTVDGGTAYTASVNGLQWTLTMDAAFAEKQVVNVEVKQTLVADAGGKSQSADYSWSFTTEDRTCNAPTAFTVTENTKGDEIKFTVNFDEKGKVYYKVLPAADPAPNAADLIATGAMIEFDVAVSTPSPVQTVGGLVSGASYKAYFVAVDASANANQSTIYAPAAVSTVDVVAPVVTAMVPANGAINVAADTQFKLSFNEVVAIGTGSVIIREYDTDIAVGTVAVAAGNTTLATADGKTTATITTGLILDSKTKYYAEVDGGTFVDLAGNPMAAISGADMWSFTTKDTVAPLLEETVPEYNVTPLPLVIAGSEISMEFNEAMKQPTGVLYVRYVSTGNVFEVINGGELTMSADAKTISFVMANVPAEQETFYVDLSELVLVDLSDNAWVDAVGTTWVFIIKDQTPPAIATIVPANGATGVDIDTDVVITFTEGIYKAPDAAAFDATSIKTVISLKDAAGTAVAYDATLDVVDADGGVVTVTLTPKADLTSETEYTVTISPVVDVLKNVSGEMTSKFTTKDDTRPYVTMWNPDYDTEANPVTGVVTVTFNEPVVDDVTFTSEGNKVLVPVLPQNIPDFFRYMRATVTRDADGNITGWSSVEDIDFTGTISEDEMVMTLTPVAADVPLMSEEWYVVELIEGVVEDISENTNLPDTTIFRIEDTEAPESVAYLPVGATSAGATMSIEFNEKIAVGTGNIYIRNYANGQVVETIPAGDSVRLDNTGMIALIKHDVFPPAMNFYVTADAGVITDASSNLNPWAGIANNDIEEWRFSTADFVNPVVPEGGLYPAPGSANVALNTAIEITFDKEIKFNTDGVERWMVIYNEDWTPHATIPVTAGNFQLKPVTAPVYQANRILSLPGAALQPNKMYYVRVMAGAVLDVAGNAWGGLMDDSWSFSTEDSNEPKVVKLTPADNATAVDHKTMLTMEFDRSILANAAGSIMLYKEEPGSLGTLIETIDPTSASVTIEGSVATIMLAENLEYETNYYVIVETGAFTNTSTEKLPFEGITTTQGWNFRTHQLSCDPVDIVITEGEVMECSAAITIDIVTDQDYVLTLNGDTIMAGDTVLASGMYTAVAYTAEGDCKEELMFEVGSDPVVRDLTGVANIGEPYHFVDMESGIDTMVNIGVHVFTYDYEGCTRTINLTVTEDYATPTIAEIQGEGDESPMEGTLVKVIGTVTAVAPGEGFFMQDANAAWSGIWVEFSDATYEGIQIGNGVEVMGRVAEVANVTSIVDVTMDFVPPLVDIEMLMVASPSAIEAEMYESVLVMVEGASATEPSEATGEWTIFYEESDNAVVNDWLFDATVVAGHYYDVAGIVNGRLDNFKLEPRMVTDVTDLTMTPVEPEFGVEFNAYPNPFNEKILIDNSEKLTRVVISNIAGQRVIDIDNPTREIRTAKLVSGIYVISLYTEKGVAKTERMIKR